MGWLGKVTERDSLDSLSAIDVGSHTEKDDRWSGKGNLGVVVTKIF